MNQEMVRFSAPFVQSIKEVFAVMMKVELRIHSPRLKVDRNARGDMTSLIGVSGLVNRDGQSKDFSGLLALSFSEPVYLAIASKMLGEEYSEYVEDIADVGSEIANIVLGKSKPALVELGFQVGMSSPSTVRGKDHQINFPPQAVVVEVTVDSELGPFYMSLSYLE